MDGEKGDIDVIAAVVALPLLVLVSLVAFDLARVPLARQVMQNALSQAVFRLSSEWNCSGTAQAPADTDDPGCLYEYNGELVGRYGTSPVAPAAYNFCGILGAKLATLTCSGLDSGNPDPLDSKKGVLTIMGARALIKKVNLLTAKYLEGGASGILNPLSLGGEYAIQFALVKLPVDSEGFAYGSFIAAQTDQFYFYPDLETMLRVSDKDAYTTDPPMFAMKIAADFFNMSVPPLTAPDTLLNFPLGWSFVNSAQVDSAGQIPAVSAVAIPEVAPLSPRLLVGYLVLRLPGILGKFSLFGGNDPEHPGDYLLEESVIKPLEHQATLEILPGGMNLSRPQGGAPGGPNSGP